MAEEIRFTMFEELSAAVRALGINIVEEAEKVAGQLRAGGIEVTEETRLIRAASGIYHVLEDGRVMKVILHITQKHAFNAADLTPDHKYHLFNCTTLQRMKSIGREHRYRMASRGDGRFNYTIYHRNRAHSEWSGDTGARLQFCQNCLAVYNARYNRRRARPFNLHQFINTNELVGDTAGIVRFDCDDIPDTYAVDWREIAQQRKTERLWRCEECNIDLSAPQLRRYLHAHHVDGQRSKNVLANIRILCLAHHAAQPMHGHLRNLPDYKKFLASDAYRAHSAFSGRS